MRESMRTLVSDAQRYERTVNEVVLWIDRVYQASGTFVLTRDQREALVAHVERARAHAQALQRELLALAREAESLARRA